MTRLYALESTSGVVTGWRPLTRDAKAYLTAEETRNLNIPFGESHPFRGGRRSIAALEDDGTLATDDLAARRFADDLSVPVTGSIGILLVGIESGAIDREQADDWLETWRETRGYYAPVNSVSEILDET
ncbi:hypothetical protein [Halococcoides cellulosivorans]|uniref:Uncharacterized protein n=1 Tax=Halococcoides cellulosivorans TaxID=1679096 RepID=A0A2R4WYE8_9EURY|nr:hypothetical protein [Halococcoides cellulosivorans]AWB26564.1 hypothetical protein HARCEL1_01965 [Halococcoides cellulosivorans]